LINNSKEEQVRDFQEILEDAESIEEVLPADEDTAGTADNGEDEQETEDEEKPAKVDRCVESILEDNPDMDESQAWAICQSKFGDKSLKEAIQEINPQQQDGQEDERAEQVKQELEALQERNPHIDKREAERLCTQEKYDVPEQYLDERSEDFFQPNKGMYDAVRKALEWKERHPDEIDGGTDTGWRRARQIKEAYENDEMLTEHTWRKINAWHSRHWSQGHTEPENSSEPWKEAGYVASLLWGHEAGKDKAERVVEFFDSVENEIHLICECENCEVNVTSRKEDLAREVEFGDDTYVGTLVEVDRKFNRTDGFEFVSKKLDGMSLDTYYGWLDEVGLK